MTRAPIKKDVNVDRVRSLFDYDHDSGWLIHKMKRSGVTVGKRAGHVTSDGYRKIKIDGENYYEHRVIWLLVTGSWPTGEIDHRNLDKSDNRFSEMRDATRSKNMANTDIRSDKKHGSSKGAYFVKRLNRWRAIIGHNRKTIHLGYFDTEMEAALEYKKAANKLFGEFARAA